MLEFNGEHVKANFSPRILEFNQDHVSANFGRIKSEVLEFNDEHVKANLKDLSLNKALLVVSNVGLITVATGCNINKNYNYENIIIENELFNDYQVAVSSDLKTDYIVKDELEHSWDSLEQNANDMEEFSYGDYEEIIKLH